MKIRFDLITITLAAAVAVTSLPAVARADSYWDCTPNEIMEYSNRVHVRCSNTIVEGGDTIRWLAIAKTDAEKAARFLNLASAALLSGRKFHVVVPTSAATNTPGCLNSNCRTPTTFGVSD